MNKTTQKPGKVVFFIFLILVFVGFVGLVLLLVEKTTTGHGLDYYMTGWGIRQNYLSALVLIAIVPVVLAVAWGVRYWQKREEKDFLRRYGNQKPDKGA